ncbi:hypothetical protein E4L95_23670 [Paracoccus liaowanqingii]|uniref:Tc1-like transposase DDE domain-containing protein n=1 Tax=Paracoccus liaowanqingii TaxID=2560053 RepID=A0A4Z1C531_9RHOB|nr:hypothetical protein E4L95_23670 [Paracoccus liaowanqingii]
MTSSLSQAAQPVIRGRKAQKSRCPYVRDVLAPELTPGSVVILDNLATHRNVKAAAAIRAAKCWFLYQPPYSPDLNPIEQAFSKLKAHLRKIGARTFDDLFRALGDICSMFSPQESWNYFHAAGYVLGV